LRRERNDRRAGIPDCYYWAVRFLYRPDFDAAPDAVMNQKAPLIIINVSNPAAFSGKGSVIVLECTDEAAAMKAARKIALETGRSVTVRTEDMRLIGTIPAVVTH
jgi:hypothetical protein